MSSVVLSSWGMIYKHLSDEQIVHAAFHDEDLICELLKAKAFELPVV
jgi:hypothetical protein